MMLLMPHYCNDVYQHVSDTTHNHELKKPGLSQEIKEAVSELLDLV